MHISALHLYTHNLEATTLFYQQRVGFELLGKTEKSVKFAVGASQLVFEQGGTTEPYVYHFAFNIAPQSFENKYRWASQHFDLLVDEEDKTDLIEFPNWNAKAFYFYDNNGSIVEFIARFDMPAQLYTDWLWSISEVGIVADNVPLQALQFCHQYDIPVFKKQPPRENFVALGNDNGLFVIPQTNRLWYLGNFPARKYPLQVTFCVQENHYILQL